MVDKDLVAIVLSAIAVFVAVMTFVLEKIFQTQRTARDEEHQRLITSIALLRNFTGQSGHPWNTANWLFNADQYPGLPFKVGEVELRLGQEVFDYSTDSELGENLFQEAKSAIKAAMMDCCEELQSLLELTSRNEVDRLHLRRMVNALVYRLAKSNRDWARAYDELPQDLALQFQLSFHLSISPNPDDPLIWVWNGQVPRDGYLPLDFPDWVKT
jgi:hypothetical protein